MDCRLFQEIVFNKYLRRYLFWIVWCLVFMQFFTVRVKNRELQRGKLTGVTYMSNAKYAWREPCCQIV
jgi:hypothetical protein